MDKGLLHCASCNIQQILISYNVTLTCHGLIYYRVDGYAMTSAKRCKGGQTLDSGQM